MAGWQPERNPRQRTDVGRWNETGLPPWSGPRRNGPQATARPPEHDAYRRQPEYQPPPAPRYEAAPQYRPPARRSASLYVAWACAAVAAVLAGAGWYTALHERHSATVTATANVQPDNEAGVRAAATSFYAFYSASQWNQEWGGLAPSVQAQVPEATWTAVHDACPGAAAGLVREIKNVTVSGTHRGCH